jgi:hypothetical protein
MLACRVDISGLMYQKHLQDAIDLAEFFVDTTATFTRFKRGAGTVGGPTESAAITKHEGFKWIRRKHYYSVHLNPEEGQ